MFAFNSSRLIHKRCFSCHGRKTARRRGGKDYIKNTICVSLRSSSTDTTKCEARKVFGLSETTRFKTVGTFLQQDSRRSSFTTLVLVKIG